MDQLEIDPNKHQETNMKQLLQRQYKHLLLGEAILDQDLLTVRNRKVIKEHFILLPNTLLMGREQEAQYLVLSNCTINDISKREREWFRLELLDYCGALYLIFNNQDNLRIWYKALKKYCKLTNFRNKYHIESKIVPGFYKCKKKDRDEWYTVQIYKMSDFQSLPELHDALQNEIQIVRSLKHQSLLDLKQVYEDNQYMYLVYYLFEGDSLVSLMEKEMYFDEIQIASMMYQALQFLKFMDQHCFFHGCLNPQNILICTQSMNLQITFINLSFKEYRIDDKLDWIFERNYEGFVAPEILEGQAPNISSDLYSLGSVLYYLTFNQLKQSQKLINQLEFFELDLVKIAQIENDLICTSQTQFNIPSRKTDISNSRIDLLKKLTKTNPKERIEMKDVTKHQWFVNIKSKIKAQKVIRKKKCPVLSLKTIIELREQSEQDLRMSMMNYLSQDKIVTTNSKLDGTVQEDSEEEEPIITQQMHKLNQFTKHPSKRSNN